MDTVKLIFWLAVFSTIVRIVEVVIKSSLKPVERKAHIPTDSGLLILTQNGGESYEFERLIDKLVLVNKAEAEEGEE